MTHFEIACHVFAWLVSLPYLTNGGPIVRPLEAAAAIAEAVAGEPDPARWAAALDVFAAHETGYGATIAGGCPGVPNGTPCTRAQGATCCGAWATECRRTPASWGFAEQARLALTMFHEHAAWCPRWPFAGYVGGRCKHYDLVDFRMRLIDTELGR